MTTTEPELIRLGQIEIRFLLESSATSGSLTQFEVIVPAGVRVPAPHYHVAYDETIYELAGECVFIVAGVEHLLRPGDALFLRRGVVHQFVNRSSETVRFLATVTPGILGPQYFRDLAALVKPGSPPDLAQIAAVMRRHGLEPV